MFLEWNTNFYLVWINVESGITNINYGFNPVFLRTVYSVLYRVLWKRMLACDCFKNSGKDWVYSANTHQWWVNNQHEWTTEVVSNVRVFSQKNFRFGCRGLKIKHLKAHNFVWQGVVFPPLLSRNYDDQLSSNCHMYVIFCIYVEIHHVWRLVLDIYQ